MGTPAPQSVDFNIRGRYGWLYIPFLSWIALVFPLILPPIPLGPIAVSLSWNRREWMSHIRRAMAHLGRVRKQYGFPWGWVVNVCVNLLDLFTGGLSHLFITAELLNTMIKEDGTDEERAQTDPVLWVLKWLVLGNVVFLALYVVCPGFIFQKLLTRLEEHLYHQYRPVRRSVGSGEATLEYEGVMTFDELAQASREAPVLLFADSVVAEGEKASLELFDKAVENLAADLHSQGVAVRWCNLNVATPTRYQDVVDRLSELELGEQGWTVFKDGAVVAHKAASALVVQASNADAVVESLALAARQVLGLPRVASVPRRRMGRLERKVTDLASVQKLSAEAPIALITYCAAPNADRATRLDIRNEVLPLVRDAVEASGAVVCVANADKKHGDPIRDELVGLIPKFKGKAAALFRDGELAEHKRYGILSMWSDYADAINEWLGGTTPDRKEPPETVEARYHVADSMQEAQRLAAERPVLVVVSQESDQATALKTFADSILPDLWELAQRSGVTLCSYNAQPQKGKETPATGVVLLDRGAAQGAETVEPGPGSAIDYVAAAHRLLATAS